MKDEGRCDTDLVANYELKVRLASNISSVTQDSAEASENSGGPSFCIFLFWLISHWTSSFPCL